MRSSSFVAIWDNDHRLPLDIELENGRLVAQAKDTSDFDAWEPIDVVVDELVHHATYVGLLLYLYVLSLEFFFAFRRSSFRLGHVLQSVECILLPRSC